MAEKLNLTLPERKPVPARTPKLIVLLLLGLLVIGGVNLWLMLRGRETREVCGAGGGLAPQACRELALKMEAQGLPAQAIGAWKEYLRQTGKDLPERAKIWYRIGKLRQDAGDFAQALYAYNRSESFTKIAELEPEINRRVQECLEALGKFSALRHELASRVEIGGEGKEEILAEIGDRKISSADLDRQIEAQIDNQLLSVASFMPEEEIRKQKEAMLKRFSRPQQRLAALQQLVLREILYRKAVDEKLADDPKVRALLNDSERELLAAQVMQRELNEQIKITPGDLQLYYKAHQDKYREPEQARISYLLLPDEKQAAGVLAKLDGGAKFEDLAKEFSKGRATGKEAGASELWIRRGEPLPGMKSSADTDKIIFSTEAGKVAREPVKSENGVYVLKVNERKPERQKGFEEVRNEVYRALRSQKEAEVQERFLARLKEDYDVVIHGAKFRRQPSATPGREAPGTAPAGTKKVK